MSAKDPSGSNGNSPSNSNSRASTPTKEEPSSDASSESSRPIPKQKPQRVRFPASNYSQSSRIYFPNGEDGNEAELVTKPGTPKSQPATAPASGGRVRSGTLFPGRPGGSSPHTKSPLTSPPIAVDDVHAAASSNEVDYFTLKPPTYIPSSAESSSTPHPAISRDPQDAVTLANTLYNRAYINSASGPEIEEEDYYGNDGEDPASSQPDSRTSHESSRQLLSSSIQGLQENRLSHILDVGLHTSGGLAPGAAYSDRRSLSPETRETLRRALKSHSNPGSASTSPILASQDSPDYGPYGRGLADGDISLYDLDRSLRDVKEQSDEKEAADVAENLVRSHTRHQQYGEQSSSADKKDHPEPGFVVPNIDYVNKPMSAGIDSNDFENFDLDDHIQTPRHEDYVAPPSHVRLGVLGSLLKLYGESEASKSNSSLATRSSFAPTLVSKSAPTSPLLSPNEPPSGLQSPATSPPLSGSKKRPTLIRLHSDDSRSKNQKWYKHKHTGSTASLGGLIMSASQTFAAPAIHGELGGAKARSQTAKKKKNKARIAEQIRITVHIADVLQRQRFILRLCRALMMYGAPTHRLEEYMKMTARVLEIDGQFLYMPGCMITSFGDPTTHTSEMHLVRCVQGLNLSKLEVVHTIYKESVHDIISVEEASNRLEDLLKSKNMYPRWLCVLIFGLAGACFSVLSFGGRWIDFPISFVLAACVGFLQIWIAPRSDLYNNVFEVTSSILASFLGRAFGSIGRQQNLFCFAAIAQGSLALILPGYIILCGSLELQSKSIVAGSVRMFYAVIYSLLLGFGITLGAVIYGWIDNNATSDVTCPESLSPWWKFLLQPLATTCLALVNQAHPRQLPVMLFISASGYVVTYFINKRLAGASQVSSAIAAFVIGILGNAYSRLGHGLAFAAMLPAIFVIVPSGVASQGSLVSGIQIADDIIANKTSTDADIALNSNKAMSLGFTMIQVSIGITVGLFVATLFVYPFGKKRSGLFTF